MAKQEFISIDELAEIVVTAIQEEPFFNKEVLIPKVRALIKGFRTQLKAAEYNKIKTPSQTAKLIRSNELQNIEKHFWKEELKKLVGDEEIKKYYSMLQELLKTEIN